jgi:prolyl oligopeptidase PreP (S9A serine peptidase family)
MAKYSPYQNISAATRYPPVLITAAINDDRAQPGYAQLIQPTQDLAVIRAQPCPGDLACFLINSVRHHRKRVHV